MKRPIKILLYILLALFVALLLAPFIFEDRLKEAIKETMEEQVNAQVEFKDISLSFLSDLPYIHISIDSLELLGNAPFENLPLYKSQKTNISTDWKSILKSKQGITIHKFDIIDADMFFFINEDGEANYDISRSNKGSNTNYFGNINAYALKECNIRYLDKSTDLELLMDNINHNGRGAFKNIVFDLTTETEVEAFSISYGGIPYLKDIRLSGPLSMLIDLAHNKYTLKDNRIKLNQVDLSAIGAIEILEEKIHFELNVEALNNQVHEILSVLPYLMANNNDILESSGVATLKMDIFGNYNSLIGHYPSIDVALNINNGLIRHKGLKESLKDIQLALSLKAQEGNWNDMSVNINPFSLSLQEDKISGKIGVSELFGNSTYEGQLIGNLDLAKTAEILNNKDLFKRGTLSADAYFDTNRNAIIKKTFDDNSLKGSVRLVQVEGVYGSNVNFAVDTIALDFSPVKSNISITNMSALGSELSSKIEVSDPLKFLLEKERPQLDLSLNANTLNLDQMQAFMVNSDSTQTTNAAFENLFSSIQLKTTVKELIYQDYDIRDLMLSSNIKDETIQIDLLELKWDDQAINGRGVARSWTEYLNENGNLELELFLNTGGLDFNKLKSTSTGSDMAVEDFKLPKNIDFTGYFESESFKYNELVFKNAEGKVSMVDGILSLENMESDLWNGAIMLAGTLNTSGDQNFFDFRYKLQDIPFPQMFEYSSLFKKLSPLSEYVDGVFNSTLVLSGPLKENLFPDIYKINASGFLETFNSKLTGLKPLQVIAEKLGIEKLKNWQLNDSRNWFEVVDGSVYFKEKDYTVEDMVFKIAGSHSLDQQIDYIIKAQIPRSKLSSNAVGKELDYSLENIAKAAQKKGININLGEFIYFDISLKGSLTDPKINIQPTGSGGESIDEIVREEIKNRVQSAKDSLSKKAEENVELLKDTIQTRIDAVEDSLKNRAQSALDTTLNKVKDKVNSKVDSLASPLIDSVSSKIKDKLPEVFGKQAQSEIDSIKAKLNDWNPFKKKKG
ncbi:MAG: hypothetical protein HKN09_13890 [Saprospiraceae bacterium]|nr:hypothetical protein [Saprospiraceae bacterium]